MPALVRWDPCEMRCAACDGRAREARFAARARAMRARGWRRVIAVRRRYDRRSRADRALDAPRIARRAASSSLRARLRRLHVRCTRPSPAPTASCSTRSTTTTRSSPTRGCTDGRTSRTGRPPYAMNNDFVEFQGKTYISFPPLPAMLMLPFVKLSGSAENFRDGQFVIWLAGLAPALLFLVLEKLRRTGRSPRTRAREPRPVARSSRSARSTSSRPSRAPSGSPRWSSPSAPRPSTCSSRSTPSARCSRER